MQSAIEDQQNRKIAVTPPRGTIYDRNGKALAESASVSTLICNPQDVARDGKAEVIAEELSVILDMDYEKIYNLLKKTNRYQVIKKRLTLEETEQIQ